MIPRNKATLPQRPARAMTYGSICSGIEAATVAWHPLGWKPSFFSEIDPFPRAVLKHHHPNVPLHGDFTTIQDGDYEPIRLLVGGTPCQSFSIAGLRGGMDDERGNLALEFCRLASRLRPAWVVWENVPGVLSSNGGRDFGSILGALVELGYGFAYRILDAQYFGIPQRRRRVFVVGYFGDWRPAAAVLFDRYSLSGHPPPRRKTRKEIAGGVREGVAGTLGVHKSGGWGGTDTDATGAFIPELSHTLSDTTKGGANDLNRLGALVTQYAPDLAPSWTLRSMGHDSSHANGGGQVAVAIRTAQTSSNGWGIGVDEQAYTLDSTTQAVAAFSAGETLSDAFRMQGFNHASETQTHARAILQFLRKEIGEEAFAEWGLGILDSLQSPEVLQPSLHGEGFRSSAQAEPQMDGGSPCGQTAGAPGTLCALREAGRQRRSPQGREFSKQFEGELRAYLSLLPPEGASQSFALYCLWEASEGIGVLRQALSAIQEIWRPIANESKSTQPRSQVRRLTPLECERLMGLPDFYTLVPFRGKPAADGPRYKAIGNSMAVPCMIWLGERIQMVEDLL